MTRTTVDIAADHEEEVAAGFEGALSWINDQSLDIAASLTKSDDTLPDAAAAAVPVEGLADKLDGAMGALIGAFSDAGQAAAEELAPSLEFKFDVGSKPTLDWLRDYVMVLIREIGDDARETVRAVVAEGVKAGQAPAAMARRLRDTVGLTASQGAIVENYRAELEDLDPGALDRDLRDARYDRTVAAAIEAGEELDGETVDQLVGAYQRRMINLRATTIARTESLRAASVGSRMAVQGMLDQPGMAGLTVERTWNATHDKRTRADHSVMDGQTVTGMNTPYTLPSGEEILHPHSPDAPASQVINCRCYESRRLIRADSEDEDE